MSRFKKLSHTLWHCQYHLVWTPKYRYKILQGKVKQEVESCIRAFSEQKKCEVVELNVQVDHVHLIASIPPKLSVSDYVGTVKGIPSPSGASSSPCAPRRDFLALRHPRATTLR